ncbi:hypothetical protein Tco_0856615 [Tanacetum coccineum]|uniref:Uncharacterized protein n=1 Tax=Tanacetum coccineum TaxID=301880 RepID=A0ABQ5B7R5_9ASTR
MVKKVDDMTIAKYIEYEERMKRKYCRKPRSYVPSYSNHCTSSNNTTIEFPRSAYFNPIQPNTEFPYDSEDMELDEEARYTTDEESVISEHEAINLAHTVNTQSFEEELSSEEDLDEWLKAKMEKHTSKQNEKNKEDAVITVIKSIREECRDVYKNKQISAFEGADLKKYSETMEDTINNDSFQEIGNPYSRRFDKYKRVFDNNVENLSNEYTLRVGKGGYEEELWRSGDEKTDYEPPFVDIKTFEVKVFL